MNVLKYKGYQGSVSYEDGVLFVRLLHIDDFIEASCTDAEQVQPLFEELVEDYLETCRAVGKQPSKPFRGSFNVRVSPELHRAAALSAAEQNVSLNSWVTDAIRQSLDNRASREHLAVELVKELVRREQGSEVYRAAVRPLRVQSEIVIGAVADLKEAALPASGVWRTRSSN